MNVCVIPARGGSKRIPRKNIKPFCGKPMLAWSVAAAHASGCFDRVLVSTDDEEIASVARDNGAEVPFMRPAPLADDYAVTQAVIAHAIGCLSDSSHPPSVVCCLYATAPFVQPRDLQASMQRLHQSRPGSVVFAATSYPYPIQRAIRLDGDGYASMFYPKFFGSRSQDLEEGYHDAGQFYWASSATWMRATNLFDGARPLVLPRWRVQDIDTKEDWQRAELMHQALKQQGLIYG